jgi:hypothetical protein
MQSTTGWTLWEPAYGSTHYEQHVQYLTMHHHLRERARTVLRLSRLKSAIITHLVALLMCWQTHYRRASKLLPPTRMSRVQVGINLGVSPPHARSVSLVVRSLKTGLASPQFHVKQDDLFETMQRKKGGYQMPKSQWQPNLGLKNHKQWYQQ